MKISKPSPNKQTGDPKSHGYNAYDFSGKGDENVYACLYGIVVQSKNSETRNWLANTSTDPYKPATGKRKLKIEDYGNYCKVRHEVDGETFYSLQAHMKSGSVLEKGTEVKKGQVLGKVGNTGNSTGPHTHFEFHDSEDKAIEVEFGEDIPEPPKPMDKKQLVIDIYKATTGEYPNDDEINARLQENKNTVELIEDRLQGDGRAKELWGKEVWKLGVADGTDYKRLSEEYKYAYNDLKSILGLSISDNTQEVHNRVEVLLERVRALEKASETKVVYKYQDVDYEKVFKISNMVIIIEKEVMK